MKFTTDLDFNYSEYSQKGNRRPLVLGELLLLEFYGEIWYTTYTSTSDIDADDEKSDYEKRIQQNKRSLQEAVERAMNEAELQVCLIMIMYVKSLALFPCLPHFLWSVKNGKGLALFIMWVDARWI